MDQSESHCSQSLGLMDDAMPLRSACQEVEGLDIFCQVGQLGPNHQNSEFSAIQDALETHRLVLGTLAHALLRQREISTALLCTVVVVAAPFMALALPLVLKRLEAEP